MLGFKTKENKPFLLHKKKYLILLHSEQNANILNIYPEELFGDTTFKVYFKPFYQLLFLRICGPIHNAYYTYYCFYNNEKQN